MTRICPILRCDVEYTTKSLKANKSPGPGDKYPEVLKLIKDKNQNLLTPVFNLIYETGNIPQDWFESIFIPIN